MSDRRLCFMSRRYRDCRTAGNKAKSDYEDIMVSMGAVNIGNPRQYGPGKLRTFLYNLSGVMRAERNMRAGDILVLQYPVKKYFEKLCDTARSKGVTTVALVHDLGSCRRRKLTVQQEIQRLDHADIVIATNQAMATWLAANGLEQTRLRSLGLHDYRSDAMPRQRERLMNTVAYAGTLSSRKNGFIAGLATLHDVQFKLYGDAADVCPQPNVTACGFVTPEQFIADASAGWGLVWDGDSLAGCTGDWGGYLELNTPHKSAFYLRAGLPLVVWSRSAIAPIVKDRELGICVDNLSELPVRLRDISFEQYDALLQNVHNAAAEAAEGANLRRVLSQIVREIQ